MNRQAVTLALLSAGLFGLSTPAAKVLLGSVDPAVLAGLLYCGAGAGVAALRRLGTPLVSGSGSAEPALAKEDVPWRGGAILAGGVPGPAHRRLTAL